MARRIIKRTIVPLGSRRKSGRRIIKSTVVALSRRGKHRRDRRGRFA